MAFIAGEVAPGYERVQDAFADNFANRGELGAAVCVYHRGEKVVDLWGGVADAATGRPWSANTLQAVFSTTKGATAACALLLAQRGELDLDAPVASYWPEFANAGKETLPVRWILSHQAGLSALDEQLADPFDVADICDRLARQAPFWEPGTAHGYHGFTYGWLVGEIVRRISGKSLGTFFYDEIATPLGLDFWIGLPESEEPRVSTLVMPELPPIEVMLAWPDDIKQAGATNNDPTSLMHRSLSLFSNDVDWNSPAIHAAEIPAANGITSARALARMYASFVGEVDGVRILDTDIVKQAAHETDTERDLVMNIQSRFGLGFMLSSAYTPMFGPGSFGHEGSGGSLGCADPDRELAFGYVMNRMQLNPAGDPRPAALIDAVTASLA
ncbi:MAG: hypothetical protein QOK28_2649 [Actinomycetota bacterium]|jgi:CubicO group peptidase (beta-lactamase class C family)